MTRIEMATSKPSKAQESADKALKAHQAAAATAVAAGKETAQTTETAEKALKAGTEAISRAYDQAFGACMDAIDKAFPPAGGRFGDLAGLQRANLEAAFAAGSRAMKNAEALSEHVLAFNRKAMEDGVATAKKLLECKTIQDVVELQTDVARAQLDTVLAESGRLADLAIEFAGAFAEPMPARRGEAVDKPGKPPAA
ncbi:MAG: phasin family protein [Candidatus Odyssella sp.]|nr:phasin family protein [Candidatus Odyssella sp.]